MRALLNRFRQSGLSRPMVGLELQKEGVAMVAQQWRDGIPVVLAGEFVLSSKTTDFEDIIRSFVARHKLQNAGCNLVLRHDEYQILLVEPPDVPEEEIRGAIRWRLKDLISIPPETAAIEIFSLPQDGSKANKKMVYVVVAEAKKLKHLIELVGRGGLDLHAIDIGELAIRNIALRLVGDDGSGRGIAIARLHHGHGSVYIYRQTNLYLTRTFSLEYNAGLLDDLPQENLALELQRSVDYYERQMGQVPPSVIYLCGDHVTEDKIGPTLRASLAIQLQILDPAATAWVDENFETGALMQCIGAFGAALRRDEQSNAAD